MNSVQSGALLEAPQEDPAQDYLPPTLAPVDLSDFSHREPFALANAVVQPVFIFSEKPAHLVSEVCVGIKIHLLGPGGKDSLGVVSISANGPESRVLETLHEICEPAIFGEQIRDRGHDGLRHEFLAHIVSHAENGDCRVESGWGTTSQEIAAGYSESMDRALNTLPPPRSLTRRFYDAKSRRFEAISPEKKPNGGFEWIDIDVSLKGELRGIDNMRRAMRNMDLEKLKALGGGMEKLASDMQDATLARLRYFSVVPGNAPEVAREKVYCIFAGKTLITLRDGASKILEEGLKYSSVRKLLEAAPTPAGMYVGLSEFCFEQAQGAIDSMDDRFLKGIMQKSKGDGKLRGADIRTLQTLVSTFEYIGGKFQEQADSLSGERSPTAHFLKNGNGGPKSLARAQDNHAQDIKNFVGRIDRAVSMADRLARTSDSIVKTKLDNGVVRLNLYVVAGACATVGAASAIVEFLAESTKEAFFYGGLCCAGIAMLSALRSWRRERKDG